MDLFQIFIETRNAYIKCQIIIFNTQNASHKSNRNEGTVHVIAYGDPHGRTFFKTSKCGFVVHMSQFTASKCKKLNLLCAWKKHSSFVGFIFKPEILNSPLARAHLAFKRSEWKTFQRHHLWICYFLKRSFKLRFVHFWLTRLPSTKTSNLKHTKMNVEVQKMVHQMHYCVLVFYGWFIC